MTLNSDFYMVILLIFMPLPLLFHLLRLFWCVFVCVLFCIIFSIFSIVSHLDSFSFFCYHFPFVIQTYIMAWSDLSLLRGESRWNTKKKTICLKIMNFKKFTHFTVIYCSINCAYIRQWRYSSVIILKQLFKCASMFNGCICILFSSRKNYNNIQCNENKTMFFTFLCSCWFCCVFVLNWNGIKSAYIELRRRKWCIYGCEYEKRFLRCFAQWTMEIHQRKRK